MVIKGKTWQVILGVLLVVGMGWSVWDFKAWKRAETDKYGHGYGEEIPSLILGNLYENQFWGIRIRYPGGWKADEAPEFVDVPVKKRQSDLLGLNQRRVVVWLGKNVRVSIERVKGSLEDLADAEKNNLVNKKMELLKEREYVNTDEVNVFYLTWKDGGIVHQRALAVEGDKLVVVDSDSVESEWKNLEPTFKEMYKSLIIF